MPRSRETRSPTRPRLAYLFKHVERLMSELHVEALASFDINARDLGVLLVIDRFEPASQQQVAERLGVDRTTMVARRPDAEDRRRNVVELTPAGQDLLRQATAASDTVEAELLAPLAPQEGEQLRDLLARVLVRG
jgi:DNA-binding MarR family transcriptional regulator